MKDEARAIARAEALLRKIREANQHFLATTGKLGARMDAEIDKAGTLLAKTEGQFKTAERNAGKEARAAAKEFFLGETP